MRANRRRDGGAGLARACKAALMCSLLAAAGIGYVRQTMDQDGLGRQVTEQEVRIAELREEYRRQTATRSLLSSPEAIQERVRQHRLNLVVATPQQRIFVTVPAGYASTPSLAGALPNPNPMAGVTDQTTSTNPPRVPAALAQLPH